MKFSWSEHLSFIYFPKSNMLSEIRTLIFLSLSYILKFEKLLTQQKIGCTFYPIPLPHQFYFILISWSSQSFRRLHRSKHIKWCFFGITFAYCNSVSHIEIILFVLSCEGVDEWSIRFGFFDCGTIAMLGSFCDAIFYDFLLDVHLKLNYNRKY